MKRRKKTAQREPTIALINVVFLMLIFFMVAGTLTQPLDKDVRLVNTQSLDGRAPPDALVLHRDGHISYRGAHLPDLASYIQSLPEAERDILRLVPDRAVSANLLVAKANVARKAGVRRVLIITQRGLK